jgi:RNA polymerase sigma factor (sigma-70 family)
MLEQLMSPENLETLSNQNTVNEYLKNLNDYGEITVLESFVNELPKKEREIIRLKFWEDLDNDEIAHQIRIERHQVEIILSNAISQLRHKMLNKLSKLEPNWIQNMS